MDGGRGHYAEFVDKTARTPSVVELVEALKKVPQDLADDGLPSP